MSKRRSDGDGSVHQMHVNGCPRPVDARGNSTCKCRWRGALVVGWKPTDRKDSQGRTVLAPVRRTVTAATRNGCAERVRKLHEDVKANTLPVRENATLEQWLNHCHSTLLPRQKRQLKDRTMRDYRRVFDQYLIPLMGHVRLDRLTSDHIDDAWQALAEVGNPLLGDKARPLSTTTIHGAHTILSRMLRLAMQKNRLTVNPAGPDSMDAPPRRDTEVEPIDRDDWRKILDAAHDTRNAPRWTVALAMGLRQGEALALRWSDVDLTTATLRVRQTLYRMPGHGITFTAPKTERAKRDIPLPPPLVAELKAHRKAQNAERLHAGDQWQDHDLVFTTVTGTPIDPSRDRKRWKALLEDAGVKHYKLHAARHTAATAMLLNGIDSRVVMEIMGWSQISTAARYQHAVSEAKRAAVEKQAATFWN